MSEPSEHHHATFRGRVTRIETSDSIVGRSQAEVTLTGTTYANGLREAVFACAIDEVPSLGSAALVRFSWSDG